VEALADKDVRQTFADSRWSLFRELPKCTANVEEQQWLFKAPAASSAARVCGQKRLGATTDGKRITP